MLYAGERKANQKASTMHTNAIKSISHVGRTCMRVMPASSLSSEFCTVQVLEDLTNCSLYRIARCSHLGVFLSIVSMVLQLGPCQVASLARWLLWEVSVKGCFTVIFVEVYEWWPDLTTVNRCRLNPVSPYLGYLQMHSNNQDCKRMRKCGGVVYVRE